MYFMEIFKLNYSYMSVDEFSICKYELFTVCNTVFQLNYLHASMKLSH
jgi:hypothetical protein